VWFVLLHATVRVPREQSARVTRLMLPSLFITDVTIDGAEADEVIRRLFSGVPGRGDKKASTEPGGVIRWAHGEGQPWAWSRWAWKGTGASSC